MICDGAPRDLFRVRFLRLVFFRAEFLADGRRSASITPAALPSAAGRARPVQAAPPLTGDVLLIYLTWHYVPNFLRELRSLAAAPDARNSKWQTLPI